MFLPRVRDGGYHQDQASGLRRLMPRPRARTLVFFGGRGGIGTTSIVASCARALALGGCSVVIVDERGGPRGAAGALGLRTRYDLLQALQGHVALDQVALNANERLSVLPAARAVRRPAASECGESARWTTCIDTIRGGWEFVLVDGVAWPERSLSPLALAADEFVIVVGRGSAALTDSYALVKRIARTCPTSQIWIVLAKMHREDEGRAMFENLSEVAGEHLGLRLDLLGCVPFDPRWTSAGAQCAPTHGSVATQACLRIANALAPERRGDPEELCGLASACAAQGPGRRAVAQSFDQVRNTSQEQLVDAR